MPRGTRGIGVPGTMQTSRPAAARGVRRMAAEASVARRLCPAEPRLCRCPDAPKPQRSRVRQER